MLVTSNTDIELDHMFVWVFFVNRVYRFHVLLLTLCFLNQVGSLYLRWINVDNGSA